MWLEFTKQLKRFQYIHCGCSVCCRYLCTEFYRKVSDSLLWWKFTLVHSKACASVRKCFVKSGSLRFQLNLIRFHFAAFTKPYRFISALCPQRLPFLSGAGGWEGVRPHPYEKFAFNFIIRDGTKRETEKKYVCIRSILRDFSGGPPRTQFHR